VKEAESGPSIDGCLAHFNADAILYQTFNLIFIRLKVVESLIQISLYLRGRKDRNQE
jgi:hypothetical protein